MGSRGMATAPATRVTARCRHNSPNSCRKGLSRGNRATTINSTTSSARQTPTKINRSRTRCSKKLKKSMSGTSLDTLNQGLGGRRIENLVAADKIEEHIAATGSGRVGRDSLETLRRFPTRPTPRTLSPGIQCRRRITQRLLVLGSHDPRIHERRRHVRDLRILRVPGDHYRNSMLARESHKFGHSEARVTDLHSVSQLV